MVPVISVRKRFGMEEIPYDDRTCIIVLEFENGIHVVIDGEDRTAIKLICETR